MRKWRITVSFLVMVLMLLLTSCTFAGSSLDWEHVCSPIFRESLLESGPDQQYTNSYTGMQERLKIDIETDPQSLTAGVPVTIAANVQRGSGPVEQAKAEVEIWPLGSEERRTVLADEVKPGRYACEVSFSQSGDYLVLFRVQTAQSEQTEMMRLRVGSSVFDLQQEIDRAEEGDVLSIPSGKYEGPFVVDKPLTLKGNRSVMLYNSSEKNTLRITSDDVQVESLTVVHENEQLDVPAVTITGDHNVVSDVTIRTNGMGMALENASGNLLRDMTIEGAFLNREGTGSMLTREGNGIDLYQSHANTIERVTVRHVQDGVYLERSDQNVIRDSMVTDARYGFHLMFTKETSLESNTSEGNTSGAMIMGTEGARIEGNRFRKQDHHVYSQGLMLYDVHNAVVSGNVMEENLVGLYVESSGDNEIKENQIYANYVGLDVYRSEGNQFLNNDVVGNMISARGTESQENTVMYNYWDAHRGLDITGERVSAIPFHADPVFPAMISKTPVYQLFADSPGLLFLQNVLDINRAETFTDTAPRMEVNKKVDVTDVKKDPSELAIFSFALMTCIYLIYRGGRKA